MAKSINSHRLCREPLEKRFVEAWEEINAGDKLLKYLLDRTHSNRGNHVPSEIEQETAVTLIQWLGSPVGQGFLRDAMGDKDDA